MEYRNKKEKKKKQIKSEALTESLLAFKIFILHKIYTLQNEIYTLHKIFLFLFFIFLSQK
jgi:hypothetical protein